MHAKGFLGPAGIAVPTGAPPCKGYTARVIEAWDVRGQTAYCKIAGVDNPEDAASFTGMYLYAPREYAAAKEPGEHYISDLVGMRVLCDGRVVGTVSAVYPDAYAPLLEIELADEALKSGAANVHGSTAARAEKSAQKSTRRIVPFVSHFFSDPKLVDGEPGASSAVNPAAPRYEIELYNPALLE